MLINFLISLENFKASKTFQFFSNIQCLFSSKTGPTKDMRWFFLMTIYSSHIVNQIFCKLKNNFLTLLTKETWSEAPEKKLFMLLTVKSPDHESSLTLIFSIQHKIASIPEFPSTLKTIALMRLIGLIFLINFISTLNFCIYSMLMFTFTAVLKHKCFFDKLKRPSQCIVTLSFPNTNNPPFFTVFSFLFGLIDEGESKT